MVLEQVLGEAFRRFAEKRPVTVMARAIIERVFEPAKLDRWFEEAKERQYTRELLFSTMFELMGLVAFKVFPTVHAAYQAEEITVSATALYNKLKRIEPETSRALVRETAGELGEAITQLKGARRPWLAGYRVKVLDGNCIEATEHRLGHRLRRSCLR